MQDRVATIVPGVVLPFCGKPESSSRSTYVGSCTTIGNRSKIIGRRGCGWWARRGGGGDENWREVRRKGNRRAYRASSPAASKRLLQRQAKPDRCPSTPDRTSRRASAKSTSADVRKNTTTCVILYNIAGSSTTPF